MSKFKEYTEHEHIMFLTEWPVQRQFNTLYELYDIPVKISNRTGMYDFSTEFNVKGNTYIFDARELEPNSGIYSIGFYRKDDMGMDIFTSKGEKIFIGEVISGVFRSLKRLIDTKDIREIVFNTGDVDLIEFYDKFSRYVDHRFDFRLYHRDKRGNIVQWIYRRKDEQDISGQS